MSKFTLIILCVVALSLSKVNSLSEEDRNVLKMKVAPIIEECSKEFQVTGDEIDAAVKASSTNNIKPCFLGCVFKKSGLIDENGLYVEKNGLDIISKFVNNAADKAHLEEVGKICAKTNDKPVSDGTAGCERAQLLISCALENKLQIPV